MLEMRIELSALHRHALNARDKGEYSKAQLADLMASIREHGLLQPLVVMKDGDGYTILAGHRRHAALKALGVEEAPCVVVDADDQDALAILLGDNATHRPVDPLREADTVAKLVVGLEGEKHPYERAAALVGRSVAWVRGRMRLTTLSTAWREAFASAEHPVREFPVGHLELVAALPAEVQDRVLAEHEGWFQEGVPLAADLRRTLSDYTQDLSDVPWDLDAQDLVPGVPACSLCPLRDSAQGDLFAGATDAKGDRCLDAGCFASKKAAFVHAAVSKAREKHGEKLVLELSWGFQDVPMPEGVTTYPEYRLTATPKSKGGFPVLRLRDMKVAYMAPASRDATPVSSGADVQDEKPRGPKTLEEKRRDLEKRRTIRALALLEGSLLGQEVEIGTEKHPEKVKPPELAVPDLPSLIALCLTFGTGYPVSEEDGPPWEESRAEQLQAALRLARGEQEVEADRLRARLWGIVRGPIARALRPVPGMTHEAVEEIAAIAREIVPLGELTWQQAFIAPAAEQIPEPRAWRAA